jgi:hypothetical protein
MSTLAVDNITDEAGTGAPNFPNGGSVTGTFTATAFSGDGSSVTNLAAANLTGDVAAARITTALNATGSAPIYACRAWVNFNGTGTVAIRASGNVSSITDNGTGDYTVNFTTAMPNTDYAALISQSRDAGVNPPTPTSTQNIGGTSTKTTSACRFGTGGNTAAYDATQVSIAIFN